MYEAVDENFLTRYFGEDNDGGDLYKCQWGLVDNGTGSNWKGAMYTNETINSMSPEETGKTFIYELKTNKKKSTQQSLKTLISKLNSDSSKTTFSSLVDADYFIKYAAVAYFAGNPDDMRNNYNNHYIYFTEDGLATVIPYDNDRCLGMTTSGKDMSSYSPYASETALQGTQANPLYNNSVIGRTSNYYTEYTEALKNVASSGWLDYSNYLKYYNIAKKNYSDVAIPDSNIKLYIKDLNDSTGKTYSNTALAFSESNSYNTSVKTYLTNILARYKEAINK
jgi:spore coat protein CotH